MTKIIWMLGLSGLLGVNVWAQDAPASLAEPPHWPIGFLAPGNTGESAKGPVKADILVWLPDGAKHIRAFFLVPNNTDLKPMNEHAALRAVATKHECGILYMRSYGTGVESEKGEPPDLKRMPALFDYVAEKTGIAEFRHAPWIAFGKSSRGKFPFRMTWSFPARTIATVVYHGETPTWPYADYAKVGNETILHLNANGETEWGGTWYNHVRPSLLNYRGQTAWLPQQTVAKDVGHGDYPDGHGGPGFGQKFPGKVTCAEVWDYIALFVDKALTLRLPKDKYPTDGPLTLKQVDETTGYVIDPFAVEESFRVPHLPLREKDGVFLTGGADEPPVSGYLALTPLKDFVVPEGVPVVKLDAGKSPRDWLITDSLKFAMAADPMVELGDLQKLMPKPGDEVTIDGKKLVFQPIAPKHVGPNGGIGLKAGLRPPNAKITLLAYTVLDIAEKKTVIVNAGYTAATRIQFVINGVPVKHHQVLELVPGKYPWLVVIRMTANWDRVEPSLGDVPVEQVALAKKLQADADQYDVELAKIRAASAGQTKPLIRKASEVPAAERKQMFWLADQELANAWLKLHDQSARKP